MSEAVPTIEIFHDVDNERALPAEIYEGIGRVREAAGRFDIVRDTRRLKIAKPALDTVLVDKVRWPRFEADINLVITDRSISRESDSCTEMTASTGERRLDGVALRRVLGGVAVISTRAEDPRGVTAHEAGHLLAVKSKSPDTDYHCPEDNCIMYATTVVNVALELVPRSSVRKQLENFGVLRPRYRKVKTFTPQLDFCDSCAEELRKNAANLFMYKAGLPIIFDEH